VPNSKQIHVVAAVIENPNNEILIAKRPDHVHQGGLWEFPGGKVEDSESTLHALTREIHEELDITISNPRPLIQIHHNYPDKSIFLDVFHVSDYTGTAIGKEGQVIQWVPKNQLAEFNFPAANQSIITAAQLPDQYLITPEPDLTQLDQFLEKLEAKMMDGIRLIQLRAKNLENDKLFQLYQDVKKNAEKHNATVILNAPLSLAQKFDAQAIHLPSSALLSCESLTKQSMLVSASCHNEKEIQKANHLGVDFIVLSPVKKTLSHPHSKPLGWREFSRLCGLAKMPVYALGGIQINEILMAQRNGGQGIAAIRALWQ